MAEARVLLEEYVRGGKLMQLATLGDDGAPRVCSVWYDAHFAPDVLRWISRQDRVHSFNARSDSRVAGAIVAIPLKDLGQTVRGVSFAGHARELSTVGIDRQVAAFVARWPAASGVLGSAEFAAGRSPMRLYEVRVAEWVLFDEENLPDDPRRVILPPSA